MAIKAGPKAAVDPSPLPYNPRGAESVRFDRWCRRYLRVPSGTGAGKPLRLREWQVDLVGSVLDASPQPRTAGWMLPRGQGKSTLLAAWGVYALLTGGEGASVVVAAVDERQAGIIFRTACRMVEMHPDLLARVQVFRHELRVPDRGATFTCLPAEPKRLEGLNYDLAILDEAGVVSRDTYEVLTLAQGKRARSTLVAIGTPGPDPHDNVLADLRAYANEHPEDSTLVWREFSAAGYEDHPPSCRHCWDLANPALDDFLHADALAALLPPKTREATFRRSRLCQLVAETDGKFLPPGTWEAAATGKPVPDGSDVVLAFDGSISDDTTALLVATVDARPHFDTVEVWAPKDGERVPIAEVEDTIRQACRRWNVVEIIADPFRWQRSLQALEAEGLPVYEFPQSPSRLTAATGALYNAATAKQITHSGEPRLAAHVAAAVIREDANGIRLDKGSRKASARKIDLAACVVMAHSRATWRANRKPRRKRVAISRRY